jgi:hypothetical protein
MNPQKYSKIQNIFRKSKNLTIVCLLVLLASCQPSDVRPGFWLNGTLVETEVGNWNFATDIEEIFIETKPWYGLPHSTTIWCTVLDGKMYIGSYGQEKKTWEKNIARDSKAKLSISTNLYTVDVTSVTDQSLIMQLNSSYNNKYDMAAVFGDELPEWWFYQVEQTN